VNNHSTRKVFGKTSAHPRKRLKCLPFDKLNAQPHSPSNDLDKLDLAHPSSIASH
jgi:hypothetical protein